MLACFQKQNKKKQKQRQNHNNIILSPCDEITFSNFCTVEVLGIDLMGNNCIIHLMVDAITYPWYDQNYNVLVKGVPGVCSASVETLTKAEQTPGTPFTDMSWS